ncbi:hypothetical protein HDU97_005067 [Phlyctochytrium planicorne]|nr:hypothetical protein HDU97_005067 [Phlyctochytrium planicorne]
MDPGIGGHSNNNINKILPAPLANALSAASSVLGCSQTTLAISAAVGVLVVGGVLASKGIDWIQQEIKKNKDKKLQAICERSIELATIYSNHMQDFVNVDERFLSRMFGPSTLDKLRSGAASTEADWINKLERDTVAFDEADQLIRKLYTLRSSLNPEAHPCTLAVVDILLMHSVELTFLSPGERSREKVCALANFTGTIAVSPVVAAELRIWHDFHRKGLKDVSLKFVEATQLIKSAHNKLLNRSERIPAILLGLSDYLRNVVNPTAAKLLQCFYDAQNAPNLITTLSFALSLQNDHGDRLLRELRDILSRENVNSRDFTMRAYLEKVTWVETATFTTVSRIWADRRHPKFDEIVFLIITGLRASVILAAISLVLLHFYENTSSNRTTIDGADADALASKCRENLTLLFECLDKLNNIEVESRFNAKIMALAPNCSRTKQSQPVLMENRHHIIGTCSARFSQLQGKVAYNRPLGGNPLESNVLPATEELKLQRKLQLEELDTLIKRLPKPENFEKLFGPTDRQQLFSCLNNGLRQMGVFIPKDIWEANLKAATASLNNSGYVATAVGLGLGLLAVGCFALPDVTVSKAAGVALATEAYGALVVGAINVTGSIIGIAGAATTIAGIKSQVDYQNAVMRHDFHTWITAHDDRLREIWIFQQEAWSENISLTETEVDIIRKYWLIFGMMGILKSGKTAIKDDPVSYWEGVKVNERRRDIERQQAPPSPNPSYAGSVSDVDIQTLDDFTLQERSPAPSFRSIKLCRSDNNLPKVQELEFPKPSEDVDTVSIASNPETLNVPTGGSLKKSHSESNLKAAFAKMSFAKAPPKCCTENVQYYSGKFNIVLGRTILGRTKTVDLTLENGMLWWKYTKTKNGVSFAKEYQLMIGGDLACDKGHPRWPFGHNPHVIALTITNVGAPPTRLFFKFANVTMADSWQVSILEHKKYHSAQKPKSEYNKIQPRR